MTATVGIATRARTSTAEVVRFVRAKFLWLDFHLGVFLAWSLVDPDQLFAARTLVLLVVSWLVVVGASTAGLALDDTQGGSDGTDAHNYLSSDATGTGLRPLARKPLLSGVVPADSGKRIAALTGLTSLVVGVVTFFAAGARPWWLLPLALAVFATVLQYSTGSRFSYRFLFGGTFVIWVASAGSMVVPFALLSGGLTAAALVQAAGFGLWFDVVSGLSNTYDRDGDRLAGRRTVAASLSDRGNVLYLVTLVVAALLLAAVAALAGWLHPAAALVFAGVALMQAVQLRLATSSPVGLLQARRLGFLVIGGAVVLLLLCNVWIPR